MDHGLVLPLQPRAPDLLAGPVILVGLGRELGFVDLPGVADNRRDGLPIGVLSLGRRLDHEVREPAPFLLEHRDLLERRVREDERRPRRRHPESPDDDVDRAIRQRQDRRQPPQRGAQRIGPLAQHRDGVSGNVLGDHLAVAVEDHAAGRRQRHLVQPVVVRLQRELRVLEDLRAEERGQQDA